MKTVALSGVAFLVVLLLAIVVCAGIGAICWPYTINTWLEYAGKDADMTAGYGALLGIVPGLGQLAIPGVAITWVLMKFL